MPGRSEDTSCQFVLSTLHVGSGDKAQVLQPGGKDLDPLGVVRVNKMYAFLTQNPTLFLPD